MFAIEFIKNPQIEFSELAARGRITLGEFSEEFVAPLVYWAEVDYRGQWREAAERILNGSERSCFVAAMRESPLDGAIFLWPAYRDGEAIYFQHKLLLPELVKGNFNTSNPYAQVDGRRTSSEEGEPFSEWQVSVGDIARFLHAGSRPASATRTERKG
jgi:hypothetical protein